MATFYRQFTLPRTSFMSECALRSSSSGDPAAGEGRRRTLTSAPRADPQPVLRYTTTSLTNVLTGCDLLQTKSKKKTRGVACIVFAYFRLVLNSNDTK